MATIGFRVPDAARRMRLEDLLCDECATLSRMYLRSLIRDGMVEVNGRHENAGYRVRVGDYVEVEADMSRGTSMVAEDIPLEIVYESISPPECLCTRRIARKPGLC
jgi:23S rRNA-/tRNA-specific pseudouridylate synthase